MDRSFLIIPDIQNLELSLSLSSRYHTGFEYNDFFYPSVYENESEIRRRVSIYKALKRPEKRDTLHGVFFDIAISSSDHFIKNYSRKLVKQSLDIARELKLRGVVFHTGLINGLNLKSYWDNWLKESSVFWETMAKEYSDMDIYMENTLEQTPDLLINLKENLKDYRNFKLCLDYGHACLTENKIDQWVKEMSPYVGHIHLNDNDLFGDLHLPPGEGKIDFLKCKKLLNEHLDEIPILLELNGFENQSKALEFMTAL